jgi:hypothetical protein
LRPKPKWIILNHGDGAAQAKLPGGGLAIEDFVASNANPGSWPFALRVAVFAGAAIGILTVGVLILSALFNFFFNSASPTKQPPPSVAAEPSPLSDFGFEDLANGWAEHPLKTAFTVEEKLTSIDVDGGRSAVQLLRLKKEGVEKARVSVIRLHDQSYWRRGKYDALEVGSRRPVDLASWFEKAQLRDRLARSEFILCIGLASSNASSLEANEQLSYQRSEKLCDWLRQSTVISNATQRLKPVPLGMATTFAEAESEPERRQRAAIVIGVSRENELIDLSTIYDEIASRVMVDGVSLSDYSRVKQAADDLKTR